jgi:hypothetical protein
VDDHVYALCRQCCSTGTPQASARSENECPPPGYPEIDLTLPDLTAGRPVIAGSSNPVTRPPAHDGPVPLGFINSRTVKAYTFEQMMRSFTLMTSPNSGSYAAYSPGRTRDLPAGP